MEDDGTEAEYGRGQVSSSTYWFKDRRRGSVTNTVFPAINEISEENLSVVWAPAQLSEIRMLDVDASTSDLKLVGRAATIIRCLITPRKKYSHMKIKQ